MRILISPSQDTALFNDIVSALTEAVADSPEHWDRVEGQPTIVDHWGYSTHTFASVVFTTEPHSNYYRLTLKDSTEHAGYATLWEIVRTHYAL